MSLMKGQEVAQMWHCLRSILQGCKKLPFVGPVDPGSAGAVLVLSVPVFMHFTGTATSTLLLSWLQSVFAQCSTFAGTHAEN